MGLPDELLTPEPIDLRGGEFADSAEYVHARVAAETFAKERAHSYLAEIIVECSRRRQKRLLIEADLPAPTTISNLMPAFAALAEMSHRMKIALVNSQVPHDVMASFGSSISHPDDVECGFFTDLAEARAWVVQGELKDLAVMDWPKAKP